MSDNTPKPVRLGEGGDLNSDRVVIFTLDGVEYTIPKETSPSHFLKYLWNKRSGSDLAEAELLIGMLGEDAFFALANYSNLTKDEWNQITEIIKLEAAGSMEDSAKN